MILAELTAVADAALPLAPLREHLRLGSGFEDDALQDGLLRGFLRAAIAAVEARTGKALLERSFALAVPAWRWPDRQPLPVAPVSAVTAVQVEAATGETTTIPATAWRLQPDWASPALVAASTQLPVIPAGGQAKVTFVAGFGPIWDRLPADLGQAVLMLAAHYYDFRHDTALGPGCMPFGVTALIERHRPLRLSGGFGSGGSA